MYSDLDPLLHSQLRLAIMSILVREEKIEFTRLREETGATAGNISAQVNKLVDAGYIDVEKKFKGNYPQTIYRITAKGVNSFQKYVDNIKKYIDPGAKK